MSNDRQILVQVQEFMNYHGDISRTLPDAARGEYNFLRELISKALAPVPEVPKKKPTKKKAKKKVSKKK